LTYREKKPETIVAEIEYQSQKYGIDEFTFADDNLGCERRSDFDHFLDLLLQSTDSRKKPYQIIRCEMSPLRVDRDSIEKMKRIVFLNVQIGFEGTSDALLRKMVKQQRFAHNIQALKCAEEQRFSLHGLNIIRGIPDETSDEVIESMKNLRFLRFFMQNYHFNFSTFILYAGAPYYKEIPVDEIQKQWNYSTVWSELEQLDFLTHVNKHEFFGFTRDGLTNSHLWDAYQMLFEQYRCSDFSYKWYKYTDGSSIIEEFRTKEVPQRDQYYLDPIETDILTFCDSVRSFSEIKDHYIELSEQNLREKLRGLKEAGFLYFNDDFQHFFISVVSCNQRYNF
jgi:radical SAM superfamily enzyme YgiQ (UPF0313 family)